MFISEKDRAYCSGLYEGEGTIHFGIGHNKNGTPYRKIQLQINMTDLLPLELFQDIMGFGGIYGPYVKGKKKNGQATKPVHCYLVSGFEKVQFIVCNVWDWLSPRRKEQIIEVFRKYTAFNIRYPGSGGTWHNRIKSQ